MNNDQSQGQPAPSQQAQVQAQPQPQPQPQARAPFFKPEQMRALPDHFTAEEKQKWENGLRMLYKTMGENPPDSQTHQEAKKKIHDFSIHLQKKIAQTANRQQAGQAQQARAAGQATQPQSQADSGTAQNPQPAQAQQPKPSQGTPGKPSEQMINHINHFPYVLPPSLTAGTPEAAKWLQDTKNKYGKALLAMENTSTQLKHLESIVKEREQQGKPLTPDEQKEHERKKETFQKGHADARRFVDNFRESQKQAAAALASNQQAGATQQPAAVNANANANAAAPRVNQQAPNQAMQNTEAVQAAMNAARAQQSQGPRPSVSSTDGQNVPQNEQGSQAPVGQAMNAPTLPNMAQAPNAQVTNIKMEGGANQPQINTAVATAPHMQQVNSARPANSPHSAIPQSATSAAAPKPLSHSAALTHAARAYSSSQTASTPNVMASHSHPSVPRETPNVNSNKMPIPKQLPSSVIGPPQPVAMQSARPTYSGGPSNSGSGLMGQPVLQKTPGFNIEGDGDRVMNKRKLDELVRQVTGGGEGLESSEGLTPEVEESILSVADEFVDQVITAACKCAKARGSKVLEIRDIQLILERNYNIRIPGYASDEIRTVRKFQPAQGWIAKMSAIQAAKVTGGKADL